MDQESVERTKSQDHFSPHMLWINLYCLTQMLILPKPYYQPDVNYSFNTINKYKLKALKTSSFVFI